MCCLEGTCVSVCVAFAALSSSSSSSSSSYSCSFNLGRDRVMGRTRSFKDQVPFDKRVEESRDVVAKYPDRVPVIVEKYAKCSLPQLEKRRYLVPRDMSVGQFNYHLSDRLHLEPGKALFIFVKNTLPPVASIMNFVYESYKDEDGFLYMYYSTEETFGSC